MKHLKIALVARLLLSGVNASASADFYQNFTPLFYNQNSSTDAKVEVLERLFHNTELQEQTLRSDDDRVVFVIFRRAVEMNYHLESAANLLFRYIKNAEDYPRMGDDLFMDEEVESLAKVFESLNESDKALALYVRLIKRSSVASDAKKALEVADKLDGYGESAESLKVYQRVVDEYQRNNLYHDVMNVEFIQTTDDKDKFVERSERFHALQGRLAKSLSPKDHLYYSDSISLEMYQRAKSKLANRETDTFAAEKKMLEDLKQYAN